MLQSKLLSRLEPHRLLTIAKSLVLDRRGLTGRRWMVKPPINALDMPPKT